MQKKKIIKLSLILAAIIVFIIYIWMNIDQKIKSDNFVLNYCKKYEKISNDRVVVHSIWTYVPSEPSKNRNGETKDTYVTEGDEITLKYVKDVRRKGYLCAYDLEGVVTNPVGTFAVKYLSDGEASVAEQFDEIYSAYADEGKYELLSHSVIPPKADDFATWAEVSTHYQMVLYPEQDLSYPYFCSFELEKEALRFSVLDKESKNVTEVVVFNRTDGNYMVEMMYPQKSKELRDEMYREFVYLNIKADLDPLNEMKEKLVVTEKRADDGALTVAVKNGSEYIIPTLHCGINISYAKEIDGVTGAGYDNGDFYDVQPGETVTFEFPAEQMEHCDTYSLDVNLWADSTRFKDILSEERRNMLKFGE